MTAYKRRYNYNNNAISGTRIIQSDYGCIFLSYTMSKYIHCDDYADASRSAQDIISNDSMPLIP